MNPTAIIQLTQWPVHRQYKQGSMKNLDTYILILLYRSYIANWSRWKSFAVFVDGLVTAKLFPVKWPVQ